MAKKRIKAVLAWLLVCSMVLPMFPTVRNAEAAEPEVADEYNYADKTVKEILEMQDRSLTWVFAGDSITHNATWTGGMNSYSEWFEQYLYDIGRGDDSVVLTAWGGANTYDFQPAEVDQNGYGTDVDPGKGLENMITKYNPDVVFLKLGMNERAKQKDETIRSSYESILDGIYAKAEGKMPKIVLLSSTPVSEETWYDDQYHETYISSNKARGSVRRSQEIFEAVAKERGLTFINLREAFLEEELELGVDYSHTFFSDSSDGIHPNAAAQYYMFKTICKELDIYKEDMQIFQLEYEDILSHALYTDETSLESTDTNNYQGEYGSESDAWIDAFAENNVWAVAGAQQMSGYKTTAVERSLFRYLDNAMRAGSGNPEDHFRDIRLYNLASPDYTHGVASINDAYEKTMATRDYGVFMLLPEIPQVYEDGYTHSEDYVGEYKEQVTALLNKQDSQVVKILWTPLASGDITLNEDVISKYAEAIREIATENSILLFDAYQFMVDKMQANSSLLDNWFEEGPYISPLCAVDVARAFYTQTAQTGTAESELKSHNLRYTSDMQKFKGEYIRDYAEASYSVDGETFTVDVNVIATKYENTIEEWKFKVLAYEGAGNFNTNNRELTPTSEVEGVYTFDAPCSEFHLAIYGTVGDVTYRFKDLAISVETDATLSEEIPVPDEVCLDSLEVVSAPSFEFEKDTLQYEVQLYQYQNYVRVRASAKPGLTIQVNDEVVESGERSMPHKVQDKDTIKVTVAYGQETKEYILTLRKPEQPDIIITEVLQEGYSKYNGAPNDIYELVEIYNASGKDLNLLDYSIGLKKDSTYNRVTESNAAEYPYYFLGNEHTFSAGATYTGIKPITYDTKWSTNATTEPTEVIFKKDSTMVIWIRSATGSDETALTSYYDTYTKDTLITALKENQDYVLSVHGNPVIPTQEQVVVAAPNENVKSATLIQRHQTAFQNVSNWVIDQFSLYHNTKDLPITRGWLFITKDTAQPATNGSITEAGNDIISAAKFVRVANSSTDGTNKLSSVFSYNYDRGMSVVKNENVVVEDKIGVGNTSDVMGYSNLTSFGAIEYWQKPTDFADKTAPTLVDASAPYASVEPESVTISLKVQDETDLRYEELYTRKAGETEFTKTSTDYVLETCVANAGVAEDVNTEQTYSYEITDPGQMVEYYARALDGNGNETLLGSEEEPILLTGLRKIEPYSAEVAKTKIGKEAPTCESDTDGLYVFAGWYADEACIQTPIRTAGEVTGDTVYALFLTKDVLSVKAQLAVQSADATKAELRFVTTVDSLRYKEAGFEITINGTPYHMPSKTVYTKLYAVNKDQSVDTLYPQMFSDVSNYFWAVTVTGIPESAWDNVITVQPYWITMDGITVNGESAGKSVTQGMTGSEAKIDNTYYHTFDAAFANAVNGDTIELFKDATIEQTYAVDKNLTITNALGNNVTLTRGVEDAMFTVASGAALTIEGDESNTITLDGNKTAITATNSMIANAGTFTLGTNATLTNGGAESLNYGGALRNTGKATLQGTISGHTAANGGAIYNYGAGEITYDGGTYTSNTSIGRGGVMYGTGTSNTIVTDGAFSQNVAQGQYGGGAFGIAGNASLTVNGGTFTGNSANNASYTGTSAYGGGAIESNGDLTINGGTFESNTAYNGGAIYLDSSCEATITAGVFGSEDKGNIAENSGGVIYLKKNGAKVTIEGGTFAYNEAAGTTGGGAIAGAALTTVDIQGGTFSNNSATSTTTDTYGGGAIETNGTLIISDGTFDTNTAFKGGAVYVDVEGQLTISNGQFLSNSTSQLAATQGGAIYNAGNNLTITGGIYGKEGQGNTAYYRGGAIAIDSNTCLVANISGASFTDNGIAGKKQTYSGGGALYITGTTTGTSVVNLTDCTFSGNTVTSTTANYGFGGSIYNSYAYTLNITGSTFAGGDAYYGGAIYLNYQTSDTNKSNMTLKDCIFSDNTAYTCADIYANRGNIYLSGKVTSMIGLNQGYTHSKLYVNESLDPESSVEIRVVTSTKTRVVVDFASDDLMTECQNNNIFYLYDDDTSHANYTLSFSNKQATVVAKE